MTQANRSASSLQPDLILASQSRFRAELLRNAGIVFSTQAASIDERDVEKPLVDAGADGKAVANALAKAKAMAVSHRNRQAVVIGCDQTLSLDGTLLHKCATLAQAAQRLAQLSGRVHHLNSAVCLVRDETLLYSHVEICTIGFRALSPDFIERHLAQAGESVLGSVGAYQIEGVGVQLFDHLEGDYFSVMGLPLIQLLSALRSLGLIDH